MNRLQIVLFAFAFLFSFFALAANDGKGTAKEADKNQKVLSGCDNLKNPTALYFKVFVNNKASGKTVFMFEGEKASPEKIQKVKETFRTNFSGDKTAHTRCEIWNNKSLVEASAISDGSGVCGCLKGPCECNARIKSSSENLEWVFGGIQDDDISKATFLTLWKSPKVEMNRAVDLANPKVKKTIHVKKVSKTEGGERFCLAGDPSFYLEYGANDFLKKACQLKQILWLDYITEFVEATDNADNVKQVGDCKAKLEMCEKLFAR